MREIIPASHLEPRDIRVPGSKSITNRALILAALANGKSILRNPLLSDDTKYMMEALGLAGVNITKRADSLEVEGKGAIFSPVEGGIQVGNAGTAMRFLTALLTLVPGATVIDGNERMRQRPIRDLVNALQDLGSDIEYLGEEGFPPLLIKQAYQSGGEIEMRGDMSSQYLSAVLMIAPFLPEKLIIRITSELVSKPYISLTLQMMAEFGVTVQNTDFSTFEINPSRYHAREYVIEGDASSASYFHALSYLHNTPITVANIPAASLQGDAKFPQILNDLKSGITEFDMNDMPDLVMTLAVIMATVPKKFSIKNVYNLRVKETDRLAALAKELNKTGAVVQEGKDFLEITGSKNLYGAEIETYDDHRMAMSFAVLGTRVPGIIIKDSNCVSKSYPDFWKDMEKIGVRTIQV